MFGRAHRGTASRGLAGQRKAVMSWCDLLCLGWARCGVVTQTSKIVRKLCGGKTNGLFLKEDEAADH